MLVGYRVRSDGTRQLLSFLRSKGEREGLLQSVSPRAERREPAADHHRRSRVHKMRNILQKVRRRDYDAVKGDSQAIYRAESRRQAEAAFRAFRHRWRPWSGPMVRQLERDLPELLSFFSFPRHLWRKLRTTNIIERCFVEVRRRTRSSVLCERQERQSHHSFHLPTL
jgi:transposase-like protein